MNESEARRVMLVRAIELEGPGPSVWSLENRQWATDSALKASSLPAESGHQRDFDAAFLARRAEVACARLERDHHQVALAQRAVQWPRWLMWILPLSAFALGFIANELGAGRRINIISFPLVGMLAWNAAVYVLIVAGAVVDLTGRVHPRTACGPLTRLLARTAQRSARHAAADPLGRTLRRFMADWTQVASALNGARARTALHASAALLAAGTVAGLYVRGLGLEYLAGWESTFLTEHAVHRLLAIVLGPASALSGIAPPGPEHLADLRWSDGHPGENAARWIHLYALTAAIFIAAPRLALALWSAVSSHRLQRDFALPLASDAYFRRLLRARHGEGIAIDVVPYSYHPDVRTKEMLGEVFSELFGGRVHVRFDEPVAYGAEDDYFEDPALLDRSAPDYLVVLFNLASTPEDENHGELVSRALRKAGAASRVAIVLDESPYRRRLAGQVDTESRLAERRRAWQAMLRARGVDGVPLDFDTGDAAAAATRLDAVIARGTLPPAAA